MVIKRRRDAKNAAFAVSQPRGGKRDRWDVEVELLNADVERLVEAIKEQAVELALVNGNSRWA